jgi:hypothetical protein
MFSMCELFTHYVRVAWVAVENLNLSTDSGKRAGVLNVLK